MFRLFASDVLYRDLDAVIAAARRTGEDGYIIVPSVGHDHTWVPLPVETADEDEDDE